MAVGPLDESGLTNVISLVLLDGEVGEDESMEAMDANHRACSFTRLSLTTSLSPTGKGIVDKI